MVKPCVGCGYCCIKTPCDVSRRVHGNGVTQCPELQWNGERYICKIIVGPLSKRYKEELYIGEGCCSNLNSWRQEVKPRLREDDTKLSIFSLDPTFQKFLFCMAQEWISGDKIKLILYSFKDILKKDGKSKDEIESTLKLIIHCLRSNRKSYIDEFMGKL